MSEREFPDLTLELTGEMGKVWEPNRGLSAGSISYFFSLGSSSFSPFLKTP